MLDNMYCLKNSRNEDYEKKILILNHERIIEELEI